MTTSEALQFNNSTKLNIVNSIDPSEIKKFIIRGDKLKIKLKNGEKIKLKGFDAKFFQQWADKKVYKDIDADKILAAAKSAQATAQGAVEAPVTSQELMQTNEVTQLRQLLEQYRLELQRLTMELASLRNGTNTTIATSTGNINTGNPSEYYNNNQAYVDAVNKGITPANPNGVPGYQPVIVDGKVNDNSNGSKKIVYGAANSTDIDPSSRENAKNLITNKEKMPDDAIAYNYQSIYELDQSGLKGIDKMSNREIIRKLFRAKNDEFVDIVETKGKENKTTVPSSAERDFLRTYFKQPMNNLVTKRDVDPLEIWEEMEKAIKANPTALSGMSNYKNNIDFWMKNEIFSDKIKTSGLNRLFKSDKEMVAQNLAKLSAMYVDVKKNQGQFAYTNRLFAMMDRAGGVDYEFAKGGLQNIIGANRDNVGQVKLSDGSELVDTKRDISKAQKLLLDMTKGNIPPYISDSNLSEGTLKDLLNQTVKGPLRPSSDGLRTLMNNHKGLNTTFDTLSTQKPDAGHMDAGLMLTEGKAFGATDAETYNIKALAEKGVLTEKYGTISDATRLMNFFADYNNNGKGGDAADFGKFSGAQLLWNYRMAVNKLENNNGGMEKSAAEAKIVSGILNKVSANALQSGDLYAANLIDTYLKNKPGDIMSLVKDHPALVKYIQKYLKNFAGDNLYALMFVDERKSLNTFNKEVETTAQNDVKSLQSQLEKIQDPIERASVKEAITKRALTLQSEISSQSARLSPDEQKYFNSFDLPSLEQNVAHTVFRALQVNPSLNGALGAGVAVDLTNNIQLNLSAATGKDGVVVPSLGLGFKTDSGVFGSNVNVTHLGANAAAFVRLGQRNNTSKLSNTLKPLTYKATSLTANVSGGVGLDRGLHVGAGVSLQSTSDKIKGVNIIAKNIRNTTMSFLPAVLDDEGVRLISAITQQSQVEGRTIQQQESFIEGPRNKFLARVKQELSKKYKIGEADRVLLDTAANNILNAILQAELQPGQNLTTKVADYMAAQWRNNSLDKLTHSYELTSLGLGIGAFIDPTNLSGPISVGAQLSVWISKNDRGAGAVNSAESYEVLRQAQEYGTDNLALKMDAPAFVKNLNGMMQASRGMPEAGKTDKFTKIRVSDDNKFIVIPADLWKFDKNLTLKIAPGTQISYDNDNNILIPRGETMRMVGQADQNKAIYVLNIGSSISSDQDHVMRRFDGDFTKKNSTGQDIFVSPDKIDTIQHRRKSKIVFTEESKATLASVFPADASDFKIEGNNIIYTQGGQQKFISVNGGVINGWTIGYGDAGIEFKKVTSTGGIENAKIAPLEYIFESFEKDVMPSIDNNVSLIEKWEDRNADKVKDFYEYAIANDDVKALSYLKGLKIPAVQAVINSDDNDAKSQLVSYITEAFALEPGYKNKNALALMKARDATVNIKKSGFAFSRISGAKSGGIDIGSLFSRSDLESKYGSEVPSNKGEPQKDLIGYTAFYRKGVNKQERGYAMTLPGYTRVLGGKLNRFEKGSSKEKDAKTWLIEKIKTDSFAMKAIKDSLAKKNLGPIKPESIQNLSPEQLVTLLTDPTGLVIDGCTLSIQANPVFYLLAECANESLGIQLEAITCTDQNGEIIKKVSTDMTEYEDGDYSENISNAGAYRTLGKRTIFKAAIGGAMAFGGSNQQRGDGKFTSNPGNGPGDGGNTGGNTGPGTGGTDGGNTGTGGQ